jgi:cytochrome c-type biogenesis protein CcmH/NrfG
MRRETLVFMLAGTAFGLVVGYMAAQWGVAPAPGPVTARAAAAAPPRSGLDANEAKTLEALAAREPRDAGVRVELGNLYMDAGRFGDAIRWYREALAIDPARPDVASDLGACLVSAGLPADGLVELDHALRRDPGHRLALYNRGIALVRLDRPREAADTWQELLKLHPDDPQAERLRARIAELRASPGGAR